MTAGGTLPESDCGHRRRHGHPPCRLGHFFRVALYAPLGEGARGFVSPACPLPSFNEQPKHDESVNRIPNQAVGEGLRYEPVRSEITPACVAVPVATCNCVVLLLMTIGLAMVTPLA